MITTTDILIVGAGPTGMTMALELAMHNVSFRIVEKDAVRSDKSRALVTHSRTLELLNRHGGLARELVSRGTHLAGATVWVNQRKAVDIDVQPRSDVPSDTQFPGQLLVSQVDTETLLERHNQEKGVEAERPVMVKEIRQDDSGVEVCLVKSDETEEIVRCRYVIGCDGAHSVVRHAANMKFEGAAYPHDFILTDTQIDWETGAQNHANLIFGIGMAMILPLRDGITRIVASRPGQVTDKDPALEDFQDFVSKMLPGEIKLHDPVWLSRFHIHHRGVDKYRDRRLFVAGDAAHIHSPVGGQGMNTGIQDAVNLAWKMALVLRGEKPDSFLDSYHDERWPVGQKLLNKTDSIFNYIASTNPIFRFIRNLIVPWLVPFLLGNSKRRTSALNFVSQLAIKYRRSPVVGTASGFEGQIRGGYRAPDGKVRTAEGRQTWLLELLKGSTHHLLLFSGTRSQSDLDQCLNTARARFLDSNKDRAEIHVIRDAATRALDEVVDVDGELHKRYGFAEAGYVYVRPDGYVEHVGYLSRMDEFVEWLSREE